MLRACLERDWQRTEELAQNLLRWLREKGFPPQTTTVQMRPSWNRVMAEFGCLICLQHVRAAEKRRRRNRGEI